MIPAASPLALKRLTCLYVEDDAGLLGVVSMVLKDQFQEFWTAPNGKQGFKLYKEHKPDLIVTDIRMPVMNGIEMIREIRKTDPGQHIVVTSAYDDAEHLVPLIDLGVDNFITKPMQTDALVSKLSAIAYRIDLSKAEAERSLGLETRLRSQIEWLAYKDNKVRFGDISSEVNAIHNLKRSLNEAAGFGAMISIVRMIKSFVSEHDAQTYNVGKDLLDLLFENNAYCERLVSGLELVERILKHEFKPERKTAQEIAAECEEDMASAIAQLRAKGHIIEIQKPAMAARARADRAMLSLAVEELLLNAAKYGETGLLSIYFSAASGYLCIHVNNPASQSVKYQITPAVERLIVEPFFRLAPTVEGYSAIERFPIGLGLPMVNFIAQKTGGFFSISGLVDHSRNPPAPCTSAQIFLPLEV